MQLTLNKYDNSQGFRTDSRGIQSSKDNASFPAQSNQADPESTFPFGLPLFHNFSPIPNIQSSQTSSWVVDPSFDSSSSQDLVQWSSDSLQASYAQCSSALSAENKSLSQNSNWIADSLFEYPSSQESIQITPDQLHTSSSQLSNSLNASQWPYPNLSIAQLDAEISVPKTDEDLASTHTDNNNGVTHGLDYSTGNNLVVRSDSLITKASKSTPQVKRRKISPAQSGKVKEQSTTNETMKTQRGSACIRCQVMNEKVGLPLVLHSQYAH